MPEDEVPAAGASGQDAATAEAAAASSNKDTAPAPNNDAATPSAEAADAADAADPAADTPEASTDNPGTVDEGDATTPTQEPAVAAPAAGKAYMPDEIPDGLMPIFFTGATQQLFGCVCDEDVTEENPQKLIPIEAIRKDFVDRAAVSDFHPCKAQMQVRCYHHVMVLFYSSTTSRSTLGKKYWLGMTLISSGARIFTSA